MESYARKNLLTGLTLITFFLLLGFFMEMKAFGGDLQWKMGSTKGMLKAAHVHGMAFGILNILYAIVIKVFALNRDRYAQTGSALAIVAGLVFPFSLFLGAFEKALAVAAPVGALVMILAYAALTLAVFHRQ